MISTKNKAIHVNVEKGIQKWKALFLEGGMQLL